MKRREFLNLTAGSAIAIAAPLPRITAAAPVAAAPKHLSVWATAMARAGNPVSPDLLNSALKVTPAQATALMNRLVAKGVVAAPNASGVAKAVTPGLPGRTAPRSDMGRHIRKCLEQVGKDLTRETEPDPPELAENRPPKNPERLRKV